MAEIRKTYEDIEKIQADTKAKYEPISVLQNEMEVHIYNTMYDQDSFTD